MLDGSVSSKEERQKAAADPKNAPKMPDVKKMEKKINKAKKIIKPKPKVSKLPNPNATIKTIETTLSKVGPANIAKKPNPVRKATKVPTKPSPPRKTQAATTPASTSPATTTPTTPATITPAPETTNTGSTDTDASSEPFICPTGDSALYSKNPAMTITDILTVINTVRTNPKAFAPIIKKLFIDPVDPQTGRHCRWGIIIREKRAVGQELYNLLLNTYTPVPAIKGNGCLIVSAYSHSLYMSDNNLIAHNELMAGGFSRDLLGRLEKWANFDTAAEAIGTLRSDHINARSLVAHIL